jgi:ketosteroid isomerase-like protein
MSFAAVAALLVVAGTPAFAGPAEDATSAVTAWIDKFNAGDIPAFLSGHEDSAIIIDEFAPYAWSGSGSAQHWLDAYMKDSAARGVSAGHMDYGKPLQASSDGTGAYIVLPTTYRFQQGGKKMAGKGSMTFVLHKAGDSWKIASWTYSGAAPVAE